MGRMQLRYGPNRAGKFGLLQPIARPREARAQGGVRAVERDRDPLHPRAGRLRVHRHRRVRVIPWGPGWKIYHWQVNGEVANVPIALLLIFALGSIGIYGFIVGGWASESKYSLLGSMRTCAQLVSYEVSLALSRARRRHPRPLALARRHRPPPGRHAAVRRPAVRRPARVLLRRHRRDAPRAVRPARGGAGARRRLPHRVLGHALGPLPDGRVHQPDHPLRADGDALLRRLARARGISARCGSCSSCSASCSCSSGCARRCRACATTS